MRIGMLLAALVFGAAWAVNGMSQTMPGVCGGEPCLELRHWLRFHRCLRRWIFPGRNFCRRGRIFSSRNLARWAMARP